MQIVMPKVFHVAQTTLDHSGLQDYLEAIGVPDWVTDAPSEAEKLIEVGGRGCYRSFEPGMNKNVTKIREGNQPYLKNILKSEHGSVIEHAMDTYIFLDVSRVLTHELVRHRISSFSQESLRFVRLDHLKCYYPKAFSELPEPKKDQVYMEWSASFLEDERRQVRLATILELDKEGLSFASKKKLTSAMRRMAPIGLATMIMYSCNHRNYRWVIENRTSRHAEEEIRFTFARVFEEQYKRYPNLYQDAKVELVEGEIEVTFEHRKI